MLVERCLEKLTHGHGSPYPFGTRATKPPSKSPLMRAAGRSRSTGILADGITRGNAHPIPHTAIVGTVFPAGLSRPLDFDRYSIFTFPCEHIGPPLIARGGTGNFCLSIPARRTGSLHGHLFQTTMGLGLSCGNTVALDPVGEEACPTTRFLEYVVRHNMASDSVHVYSPIRVSATRQATSQMIKCHGL